MKKLFRNNLSVILGVLLFGAKVYIVYTMNLLPEAILAAVDVTEHTQVVRAEVVARPIYTWLAVDFILVIALAYSIVSSKLMLSIAEVEVKETRQEDAEKDLDLSESESVAEKQNRLQTIMTRLIYEQENVSLSHKLESILSTICTLTDSSSGILYLPKEKEGVSIIEQAAGFAVYQPESNKRYFEYGDGLAGQVAKSMKAVYHSQIPEGYIQILSGLGSTKPGSIAILPCVSKGKLHAVLEIAAFKDWSLDDKELIDMGSREVSRLIDASKKTK